ncbi:MAG: hypothetical protein E7662_12270 [Ruminococcaceae bacterium]|nr:hypothetical protein [Oscillospiraceae bacterium]
MNISDIDPNFKQLACQDEGIRYYSCMEDPIEINGMYAPRETGKFLRMPEEYIHSEGLIPGVRKLIHHSAGGRLRFATDSPCVAVMVELTDVLSMAHMPLSGASGVDIYLARRGSHDYRFRKVIMPYKLTEDKDRLYKGMLRFSGCDTYAEHEVMIHLPLYNGVKQVYVGIQEGCSLFAPVAYDVQKPVIFYGDSITQGGCASHPGNNYPNHLSRWLHCDFINLGFSGSSAGEPEMADYIASLDSSAIFVNMELRAYDIEVFRSAYYPFYARLREHCPNTPIILASRGAFPKIHKYGPEVRDFVLSNRIIVDTCLRGWNDGDEKLYYIDGETMFGNEDQDACTVDGTHPNDLGFYRMAERIRPVLARALDDAR